MRSDARYENVAVKQAAYRSRLDEADVTMAKRLLRFCEDPKAPFNWKRWAASMRLTCHLVEDLKQELQQYRDRAAEGWDETDQAERVETLISAAEDWLDTTRAEISGGRRK